MAYNLQPTNQPNLKIFEIGFQNVGLKVGELGWLGSRLKLKHRRIVCFRKKPKQASAPRIVRIEEPHTKAS